MWNLSSYFTEYFLKHHSSTLETVELNTDGRWKRPKKLRVVIDFESAPNRFNSDHYMPDQHLTQWKQFHQFFEKLKSICSQDNLQLIFFFDGTCPKEDSWLEKQIIELKKLYTIFDFNVTSLAESKDNIKSIMMRHLIVSESMDEMSNRCSKPEKSIVTFYTYEDHQKEILSFCRIFSCDYLLTDDPELIATYMSQKSRLPRHDNIYNLKICSARLFNVENNNTLTTKMFDFDKIFSNLKLGIEQFAIFSILLGNKFIPSCFFSSFYERLKDSGVKIEPTLMYEKIINFIRVNLKYVHMSKFLDVLLPKEARNCSYKKKKFKAGYNSVFHAPFFTEKIKWVLDKEAIPEFIVTYIKLNDKSSLSHSSFNSSESKSVDEKDNFDYMMSFSEFMKILHVNCFKSPFISHIIKERYMFVSLKVEPDSDLNKFRIENVYHLVRAYCYKVIFSGNYDTLFEINREKEVKIIEHILDIKRNDIAYKDFAIKGLYDLNMLGIWNRSRRFKLLQFLRAFDCSELLEEKIYFNNIPVIHILPSIILRFLLKQYMLNNLELKTFVFTLILSGKFSVKNTENPKIDKRSVYLAALFVNGIAEATFVNDVSGYPLKNFHFQVTHFFDSDVFFSVYNKLYSNQTLDLEEADMKIISNVYSFITEDLDKFILPGTDCVLKPQAATKSKEHKKETKSVRSFKCESKRVGAGRGILVNALKSTLKQESHSEAEDQYTSDFIEENCIVNKADDKTESASNLEPNSTTGEDKCSYPIEEFLKLQDDLVKTVETNKKERPYLHVVDFKNVPQLTVSPNILELDQSKTRRRSTSLCPKKINTNNVPMIIDESVIKSKLQRLNLNLNDYKHLF